MLLAELALKRVDARAETLLESMDSGVFLVEQCVFLSEIFTEGARRLLLRRRHLGELIFELAQLRFATIKQVVIFTKPAFHFANPAAQIGFELFNGRVLRL